MAVVFQFPFRTVAEIHIQALLRNLHEIRQQSGKEVIPVVKADAYGHGLLPIAKALVQRGSCEMLAVATLEEALEVRKALARSVSILVLSGFFPHQLDAYQKQRITPMIHSLHHLKSLVGRKHLPDFHLKIDSGMHRLGITVDQMPEAIKLIEKLGVKLAGVATHFAESESLTTPFTDTQTATFEEALALLRERRLLNTDARIHLSNSGAIFSRKWGRLATAVRPGLALYGIAPNDRLAGTDRLVPILDWKARISALKDIARGETVGYGRTYEAKKKERIAILPVGYADGFPRLLSNRGEVLIRGKRCPVRGRVSMDLIAVDVSGVSAVKEGDLAVLIGRDAKQAISAWDLAVAAETIPYEITCGISSRVPRIYLE